MVKQLRMHSFHSLKSMRINSQKTMVRSIADAAFNNFVITNEFTHLLLYISKTLHTKALVTTLYTPYIKAHKFCILHASKHISLSCILKCT